MPMRADGRNLWRNRQWMGVGALLGLLVGGGIWLAHAAGSTPRTTAPAPHRLTRRPGRTHRSSAPPAPPVPFAGLHRSFAAATGLPASTALEVVTLPWNLSRAWAVDPVGVHRSPTPTTLWFGERTGTGPWQWIPSRLPGGLSPRLPVAVRDALARAYDLSQGQPGPTLPGAIQWQALAGHVGLPVGWTLQVLPADASPLAQPSVALTVWQASYTGTYNGFYGLDTVWDGQNAGTGRHGVAGFQAAPGPMTAIAARSTP